MPIGSEMSSANTSANAAEFKGEWQPLENEIEDRRIVGLGRVDILTASRYHAAARPQIGLSKIAARDAGHITRVLNNDWIAQTHFGRDLLDHIVRRHAADDETSGIGGRDAGP